MEKNRERQARPESRTEFVEQINICLRSSNYSRAQDLLRDAGVEFPNDAELTELGKLVRDGVKHNAEAQRLITESQELFAHQKSGEAIQLLRKAYELDKNNSLARTILANALVEHAHSIVEADWLQAETLTNQALALNPAHPTAKTVLSLIVYQKKTSSVEDWVSQASKLQSSGDLFAALAWVAEGLAVHPHDPKLLQIQDEIQRDQDARRRQARRGDLDELRRLQRDIDSATDVAAKQALAVRIQTVAAKHWTDGEILSIANALLLRLGLVSQESSSASPRGKGATVILHVPRPGAPTPKPSRAESSEIRPTKIETGAIPQSKVLPSPVAPVPPTPNPIAPGNVADGTIAPSKISPIEVPPAEVAQTSVPSRASEVARTAQEPKRAGVPASTASTPESSMPVAKVASPSSSVEPSRATKSNSTTPIFISAAAAIVVIGAIFFFARKHQAPPIANTSAPASDISPSPVSAPAVSNSAVSAPTVPAPAQTPPEPSLPASGGATDSAAGKVTPEPTVANDQPSNRQPPAASGNNVGALLVVTGQDNARVFLNGKLQRQPTQAGQLRLPNLEAKDYVVQVSKTGFQDPPQQQIRIRRGEEARLVFNFRAQPQPQPVPRMASLNISGGLSGTTVFVDQKLVGTIQPDGTLAVSSVTPGDHTVELRKERFQSRQFNEHFAAGGAISLARADAVLEAASSELKITFAPADARVAIVKGELLKIVNSGAPLNLSAGTYTLTARTSDGFTRSSTLEVVAGVSKTLDLSLAPAGMSNWDDPNGWKHEKDFFVRKGGDFVLYGAAPSSGTFVFSAMLTKGRLLQWVLNYTDAKNYVLYQMDDNNFYRIVMRNGVKTDEIIVPHKGEKKSFRTLQIRVSGAEIVHQIKDGDRWIMLDRWAQPGTNLGTGKFGFYIPGDDQVALSSFAHYGDLKIR